MSAENMQKFQEMVSKDKAVAESVQAAGANVDAIIGVAKSKGLDIDVNDIHQLAADVHKKLSDADLDAVAGGGFIHSIVSALSSAASAVTHITSASQTAVVDIAVAAAE